VDECKPLGTGFAAAAAAANSQAAMAGYDGNDAMGMDGGEDPALMLALRVSLEEERARQETQAAAAVNETEAAAGATTTTPTAAAAATPGAEGDDPMMMDEDALLQRAFALSMGRALHSSTSQLNLSRF
jgi:26S proteasome regulatory subunit N10